MCRSVPSEPPSSAFATAVCGLGELVSWLWHSEGADMNIKNGGNDSLLYLASKYVTSWVMGCVLTRGAKLDINGVGLYGTALGAATSKGELEMATLLLDRGADINIRLGGKYGTALGAAGAGGELEIVTLLLISHLMANMARL